MDADARQTFRQKNIFERCAAQKRMTSDALGFFRQKNVFQRAAIRECVFAEADLAVRKENAAQRRAPGKRMASDDAHTFREENFRQRNAVVKRIVVNRMHIARNADLRERNAAVKCVFSDRGHTARKVNLRQFAAIGKRAVSDACYARFDRNGLDKCAVEPPGCVEQCVVVLHVAAARDGKQTGFKVERPARALAAASGNVFLRGWDIVENRVFQRLAQKADPDCLIVLQRAVVIDIGEGRAFPKRARFDLPETFWQRHAAKRVAAVKAVLADGGYTVRHTNIFERVAVAEGILQKLAKSARQRDVDQRDAVLKTGVADVGHALWNRDAHKTGASRKGAGGKEFGARLYRVGAAYGIFYVQQIRPAVERAVRPVGRVAAERCIHKGVLADVGDALRQNDVVERRAVFKRARFNAGDALRKRDLPQRLAAGKGRVPDFGDAIGQNDL